MSCETLRSMLNQGLRVVLLPNSLPERAAWQAYGDTQDFRCSRVRFGFLTHLA